VLQYRWKSLQQKMLEALTTVFPAYQLCLAMFFRVNAFFITFPFFRSYCGMPIAFTISLPIALWLITQTPTTATASTYSLTSTMIIIECLIGVLIAAPLVFLIEWLQCSGRLIDYFRGAQAGEQTMAMTGERQTNLEALLALIIPILLFSGDKPIIFDTLLSSSVTMSVQNMTFDSLSVIADSLITISSALFKEVIIFVLPIGTLSLIIDITIAIIYRTFSKRNCWVQELNSTKLVVLLFASIALFYVSGEEFFAWCLGLIQLS